MIFAKRKNFLWNQRSSEMPSISGIIRASGLCGKFGNKLFTVTVTVTVTVVRARRKNAGIAGPTSSPCYEDLVNAAMAAVLCGCGFDPCYLTFQTAH